MSPRRVARVALGIVLAVALVAACGLAVVVVRLPQDGVDVIQPAALGIAAGVPERTARGAVEVRVTRGGRAGVRVLREGRTLWASDPGSAFLTAGRGRLEVEEYRGYFWPRTAHDARLTEQRIESVTAAGDGVRLTGRLSGDGGSVGWIATVTPRSPGIGVDLDVTTDESVDSLALVTGRSEGAGVHGFGAQFTDFDLSGRVLPIIVREQGVGRGQQPLTFLADVTNRSAGGTPEMTYAAWSSFVTDDLRGVRLDPDRPESHAVAVADTRDEQRVTVQVWADRMRAQLDAADSPAALVAAQQAGVSRPALPRWAGQGAIIGLQGGTAQVRRQVGALRQSGARISAVWLQDWSGQRRTSFGERLWWTWQVDRKRYPEWDRLVADLAADGIRTTTYVNTFLVEAAPTGDPGIRNLFAEARSLGHLVRRGDGTPYLLDQGGFDAALVDLTSPAARAWYARVIADEVLADGVDGFMADFGEGLPFDAALASGDPVLRHDEWPRLWAQVVRDACDLAGKPQCVTWFRSGSLGMDAEAPLFWMGDQMVDLGRSDGLASALLGQFSSGVSGWPLSHTDVGGYTSVDAVVTDYRRSPEVLARWAETAAFGVVMRTHEGNRPDENVQVVDTPATRSAFARMTRLFAALEPYRREVVAAATRTGVPAVRHPWLVVPGTATARSDDVFFFGGSVLVAPVLEEGADTVRVPLPRGRWRHLITGSELDGGRVVEVAAPVGTPAAFVRADDPWAARLGRSVTDALRR
jgi:sulfoquinovosidase